MKRFISLFSVLCITYCGLGQNDIKTTTLNSLPPSQLVVIINGYTIYDTSYSYKFLRDSSNIINKRKIYSKEKGKKKFGISSVDGILVCTLRRGVVIDFDSIIKVE